jgi:hypothetical protein
MKKLLEDVQNVPLRNQTVRATNCEFLYPMAITKPYFFVGVSARQWSHQITSVNKMIGPSNP